MKRRHKTNRTGIVFVMVLLIVIMSGCGKRSAKGNDEIRIFFALNQMDTFRQTLVNGAAEKAAQEGVQFVMEDAQGSIERQVEQLKKAAAENYDVIICSPVSVDTVVQLKMSVEDIPIVFVNSCPEDKHLQAGKYVYVGSDGEFAGEFQAEYILNKLPGKQELNVVLITGPENHSATKKRVAGVKRALGESGRQIHYVFEDSANWDAGQAQKLFELFLRTGASVDCVICNNDSMALGIVEACKDKGIDCSTLPILGVDATKDGCDAIRNNEMAFTVYQSGVGQGHAAVDAALRLIGNGKMKDMQGITEDGKYVWVDFERVDSSNVSNYGN